MSKRLKPLIDSTYPAVMAGLCLTSLGILNGNLSRIYLQLLLSSASLIFIISSVCIFANSIVIDWDSEKKEEEIDETTWLWDVGKFSFFFGILLLLISIFIVNYYLLIDGFQNSNYSYF